MNDYRYNGETGYETFVYFGFATKKTLIKRDGCAYYIVRFVKWTPLMSLVEVAYSHSLN